MSDKLSVVASYLGLAAWLCATALIFVLRPPAPDLYLFFAASAFFWMSVFFRYVVLSPIDPINPPPGLGFLSVLSLGFSTLLVVSCFFLVESSIARRETTDITFQRVVIPIARGQTMQIHPALREGHWGGMTLSSNGGLSFRQSNFSSFASFGIGRLGTSNEWADVVINPEEISGNKMTFEVAANRPTLCLVRLDRTEALGHISGATRRLQFFIPSGVGTNNVILSSEAFADRDPFVLRHLTFDIAPLTCYTRLLLVFFDHRILL